MQKNFSSLNVSGYINGEDTQSHRNLLHRGLQALAQIGLNAADNSSSSTGDTVLIIVGSIVLVAAVVGGIIWYKRRNNNNDD